MLGSSNMWYFRFIAYGERDGIAYAPAPAMARPFVRVPAAIKALTMKPFTRDRCCRSPLAPGLTTYNCEWLNMKMLNMKIFTRDRHTRPADPGTQTHNALK